MLNIPEKIHQYTFNFQFSPSITCLDTVRLDHNQVSNVGKLLFEYFLHTSNFYAYILSFKVKRTCAIEI